MVLALVTTFLAVYTALLWRSTKRLVEEAKDTTNKQLRAYLSGHNGKLFFIPGHTFRAEVELRNSGATPARNVRWAITGKAVPKGQTVEFKDPDFAPGKHPIAPNSHWTAGHEFLELTPFDAPDIYNGTKWVYVWGHAEYFDIFGKRQTLKFRYRNAIQFRSYGEDGQARIEYWWLYPEGEGNEAT